MRKKESARGLRASGTLIGALSCLCLGLAWDLELAFGFGIGIGIEPAPKKKWHNKSGDLLFGSSLVGFGNPFCQKTPDTTLSEAR